MDAKYAAGRTPSITVRVEQGTGPVTTHRFSHPFSIGQHESCDVVLKNPQVGNTHAEVFLAGHEWFIRDLHSKTGLIRDGERITRLQISGLTRITLGTNGPALVLEPEKSPVREQDSAEPSLSYYIQHYFGEKVPEKIGDRTLMIRKAFSYVRKKHSYKYLRIIAVFSLLLLSAVAYGIYKHYQVAKQEKLAQDVFYRMKTMELAYAALERQVPPGEESPLRQEIDEYRLKRKDLTATYDQFIAELGIYKVGMNEKERAIYHVARIFGECEVSMPDDFIGEVERFIDLWKTSNRLHRAIQRAETMGYPARIAERLIAADMPPQFFFLALQESEFDSTVCGPPTKFGIAKGLWQFMPSTAIRYGLRTGPLVDIARPDPRDERHDVDRATVAAAHYLKDMYNTEAQASGLLVIASYNWGHNLVRTLIRKMPENPRQRNFWTFLTAYKDKIPAQTYDYVFYIFSAAVICENPHLFGFDFPRPLDSADQIPSESLPFKTDSTKAQPPDQTSP